MSLFVTEIFHSIQGESTHSGRPCVFVRLSGCNMRCTYCDTSYAYAQGTEMDIQVIIDQVDACDCPLVEITGGEPLLQAETPALISQLLEQGHEVMLETNGSLDIRSVDNRCIKVVDVKCPTSGETDNNHLENLNHLNAGDQVKFVIGSREDYAYAKNTMSSIGSHLPSDHILFSPVFGQLDPATLAEWMLADRLDARYHLQLHKLIWPDKDRGV
ncbi:MAG: radical SAM protein [Desulfobacterales bacterium]